VTNSLTSETSVEVVDALRSAIDEALARVLRTRNEKIAELLVIKLMGVDVKLVEERSPNGLRTTWRFEIT
jgi:hypothetical protein